MIQLRKLHLVIGFTLVPFLLVTAGTGLYVLLANDYSILRWHSWFRWGGIVLGAGLSFLAVTGAVLYLSTRYQQLKRRKKAAVKPPPEQK